MDAAVIDLAHSLDLIVSIDDLIDHTQDALDAGDVEELAKLHLLTTKLRQQMSDLARAVEERLAEVMPDKRLELPGLPVLERHRGTNRKKWQSEELLSVVVGRSIVDGDGALATTDPIEIRSRIEAEVRACLPITGSLGWRVTALRDRGIDPDEFCATSPGRVSIQIHEEVSHA